MAQHHEIGGGRGYPWGQRSLRADFGSSVRAGVGDHVYDNQEEGSEYVAMTKGLGLEQISPSAPELIPSPNPLDDAVYRTDKTIDQPLYTNDNVSREFSLAL